MKWAILVLIVAIVSLLFINKEEDVPILSLYPEKVVYTNDLSLDTEIFIKDCSERRGEFNSCGSPCAPEEEYCVAVCAYTCDFTNF